VRKTSEQFADGLPTSARKTEGALCLRASRPLDMLFATTNTSPTKDATMRNSSNATLACLVGPILATLILAAGMANLTAAEKEVPLDFAGGHDVGRNDYGRPVPLIAAALGVKPDDFRKAFSGVTPAKGGPPSGDEAKKNKDALMKVLAPLGVANDRLDEVSNYYRYQPQRGELWKTTPAQGHALIEDGRVNKLVIIEPGSGYSSPPKVSIKGMEGIPLKATLRFDKDFRKNGSIQSVEAGESTK
jgi:hypothetical protein